LTGDKGNELFVFLHIKNLVYKKLALHHLPRGETACYKKYGEQLYSKLYQ